MAEIDPFPRRQLCHQIALDFHRVLLFRQPQPLRQPRDVGIDHHARGNSERGAQHDIGRFASHAGQLYEFVDRLRHLAVELIDQLAATFLNAFGLVAKEAGALNRLFQLRPFGGGVGRGGCGTF